MTVFCLSYFSSKVLISYLLLVIIMSFYNSLVIHRFHSILPLLSPNRIQNNYLPSRFTILSSLFSTNQDIPEDIDTGAFKSALPIKILAPEAHYAKAVRQTSHAIKYDSSLKNQRQIHRKYVAQSLDELMKRLNTPLTEILTKYHPVRILKERIHPYEATVANLTMIARTKKGYPDLASVLEDIKQLRMTTSRIAKEYAMKANTAQTAIEAKEVYEQGFTQLKELYETSKLAKSLVDILEIQKDLRKIPVIELETPTVVLVGAPNVGKSSIVRCISSGTPEVNDYPFTTRGVTIGHIIRKNRHFLERIQVMDTPGLLDRPAEDRNEMEKLTFASLAHLPTAVIFVIDPTGLSGEKSTLQAQLNSTSLDHSLTRLDDKYYSYLKSRFPRRPWMDVISKGDISISQEIQDLLPQNHLCVSVKTGLNVDKLVKEVELMMERLVAILESSTTSSSAAATAATTTPSIHTINTEPDITSNSTLSASIISENSVK